MSKLKVAVLSILCRCVSLPHLWSCLPLLSPNGSNRVGSVEAWVAVGVRREARSP